MSGQLHALAILAWGKKRLLPAQQDATDTEMVWTLCKGEISGPCWKLGTTIPQQSRPQPSHYTDSAIPACI